MKHFQNYNSDKYNVRNNYCCINYTLIFISYYCVYMYRFDIPKKYVFAKFVFYSLLKQLLFSKKLFSFLSLKVLILKSSLRLPSSSEANLFYYYFISDFVAKHICHLFRCYLLLLLLLFFCFFLFFNFSFFYVLQEPQTFSMLLHYYSTCYLEIILITNLIFYL